MLSKNMTIHERRVSAVTIVLDKFRDSLLKVKSIERAFGDHKALIAPYIIESLTLSDDDKNKVKDAKYFIVKAPMVVPSKYYLLYANGNRLQVVNGSMYENPSTAHNVDPKSVYGDVSKILTGIDNPTIDYHYVEPVEFKQWTASGQWQKGVLILIALCLKYTLTFVDVARFMMEVRRSSGSAELIGNVLETIGNSLTSSIVAPKTTAPLPLLAPKVNEPIVDNPVFVKRLAQTLSIHPDQFVDPSHNLTLGELPFADMKEFLFKGIKPRPSIRGMLNIKQLPYASVQRNADPNVPMVDPNAYTKPQDVLSVNTIRRVYDNMVAKYGDAFTSVAGSKDAFISRLLI